MGDGPLFDMLNTGRFTRTFGTLYGDKATRSYFRHQLFLKANARCSWVANDNLFCAQTADIVQPLSGAALK